MVRFGLWIAASVVAVGSVWGMASSVESYGSIVSNLRTAGLPVHELKETGGQGRAAVTLAAGRVFGLAFSEDGPNLFWSNPAISGLAASKIDPLKLSGGVGGDRMWFSPELDYHWSGVPDWAELKNYKVPSDTDPGRYSWLETKNDRVAMGASARLNRTNGEGGAEIDALRAIKMIPPPSFLSKQSLRSVDFVGLGFDNKITLKQQSASSVVDMWHLLQVPAGSVLIVPLRKGSKNAVTSYALPGSFKVQSNRLSWKFTGEGNSKIGIAAKALTGRTAVLRKLSNGQWLLLVREFPVDAKAEYVDHPLNQPLKDQAFQAWDGGGFGEMEYHTPAVGGADGATSVKDKSALWAFGGKRDDIAKIGDTVLATDIRDLF